MRARSRALRQGGTILSLVVACGPVFGQPLPSYLVPPPPRDACVAATVVERNGQAVASPLFAAMTGFARLAEVAGGLGHPILAVTTTADADPRAGAIPAGSLRAAVEAARRQGGGWIVFAPSLGAQPTIALAAPLRLPSNLTLDGGCSGVRLTARPDDAIFAVVAKVQNVAILRLDLQKVEATSPHTGGDCLTVGQEADRIWVAYNSFRHCGDGMVDITQSHAAATATRITVAFNRFADHDKVMINATLECLQPGQRLASCANPLDQGWDWGRGVQVTLQGNAFLGTGQRHPRLQGRTYTHMLDNVVAFRPYLRTTGEHGASYGTYVGGGARAMVENNLYIPLPGVTEPRALFSSETSGRGPEQPEARGAMRARGNLALGAAVVDERHPELVPAPPYALRPERQFMRNPERGARCVIGLSGPAAPLRAPPVECGG